MRRASTVTVLGAVNRNTLNDFHLAHLDLHCWHAGGWYVLHAG
jgi:hypothetical protein